MRRVASVWFPHWPTDRLRRRSKPPAEASGLPLVAVLHDGRRRVVSAVDQAAARIGLRAGMAVAQALALVPDLRVVEAEPEADAAALHRLALWCQRYTPLACPCPPDGVWLEIGGSAHLFGGEEPLLIHLLDRLRRDGIEARGAVADTPGAAHALARHGGPSLAVAAPGTQMETMAGLPVACLRLVPELETVLRRLGFEQVGHLARIPRAVLARRFGPLPGLRLDQVQGVADEPLVPLPPPQSLQRREAFLEPLLTAEALGIATIRLVGPLCGEMEGRGLGARRMDLLFERIDNQVVALRIGTVQPSRDAAHLVRLLLERLDTVEPGPGIEAMTLVVSLAEPLRWEQQESGAGRQDVARLVDRLSNRLGRERVYRALAAEAPLPEHLVRKGAAMGVTGERQAVASGPPVPESKPPPRPAGPVLTLVASVPGSPEVASRPVRRPGLTLVAAPAPCAEGPVVLPWRPRHEAPARGHGDRAWPGHLRPPVRLLAPPHPVITIAALPDEAPVVFEWRRRYRITRSEGPERVHEAWWHGDAETDAVRDYFQVEVESGQRFWLFRRGNGLDPRTGDLAWFLHGVF